MPKPRLITPTLKSSKILRVAAYCRVSSSSADQLNSYVRQVEVYTKLINSRPDWELVEVFADEGISGTSAEKRPEFMRMITMCEKGQIDLIITKSMSRFCRNQKESTEYVRKLKLLGVGVQFEKEGINTLLMNDEMLMNIFAAIAQEESQAISQHLRTSIVKRMELGEYVECMPSYGFRIIDRNLCIFEPEAEVVREIFAMYLDGMSIHKIADELNANEVPTKFGGIWYAATVSYILTNERYVGDSLFQKTYTEPTVPFKRHVNRGEADQFYATDTHPYIVDRDTFDKVQSLFQKRKERFNKIERQQTYPLTSRIRCAECGSFYRRKVRSGCIKWVCTRHEKDASSCHSYYYDEERIYDGFIHVINKLRFGQERILDQVAAMLNEALTDVKHNSKNAMEISEKIAEVNGKILMLDQLHTKGILNADIHRIQVSELQRELRDLRQQRQAEFTSPLSDMADAVKKLRHVLGEIEEPLEEFDDHLFEDTVTDILIDHDDQMTITLLGGLKFTERI